MIVDQSMIGAPVIDRDGHQIGTVKQIEGSAFKVDAPMQLDYWLHFDGVQSATIGRVILTIDADHLHEFKLDSPGDVPPYRPDVPTGTYDEVKRHEVGTGSESYGVHDGTMVGEVVTGQPPRDNVIRKGAGNPDTYDRPDVRTPVVGRSPAERTASDEVIAGVGGPGSAVHDDAAAASGMERHGVDTGSVVDSGVLRNNDIPTTGVTSWGDVSPRFRREWQAEHNATGTWEELEPGYHFGYEMAHDPRFLNRSWDDAEPDLRTEWISWSGRSGAMSDATSWDRVRASARHAWESARAERRAA